MRWRQHQGPSETLTKAWLPAGHALCTSTSGAETPAPALRALPGPPLHGEAKPNPSASKTRNKEKKGPILPSAAAANPSPAANEVGGL